MVVFDIVLIILIFCCAETARLFEIRKHTSQKATALSALSIKRQVDLTGCLQLLEIYWSLKTLLEILEFAGPPGNLCVR